MSRTPYIHTLFDSSSAEKPQKTLAVEAGRGLGMVSLGWPPRSPRPKPGPRLSPMQPCCVFLQLESEP